MAETGGIRDERPRRLARALICAISLALLVGVAPAWWGVLTPDPARPRDFFQDWASARNVVVGRPAYTSHRLTLRDYLGIETGERPLVVEYNAHPPPAILLALPLAGLDFAVAGRLWNLASLALLAGSLALIGRELGWRPRPWTLLPSAALLLLWVPLWLHLLQGQLGLVLLALCTAAWAAGRRGHDGLCGVLIGLAAAIKLFPALLLGYLALRGRPRAVAAGLLSLAAATAAAVATAGPGAYRDYAAIVLPGLDRWRADWINASLVGYFARLFAPDAATRGLTDSPPLAAALTALAALLVVAVVARAARGRPADWDAEYGLALTATLLLSALTWAHGFVLLLLPLAIWWPRLARAGRAAAGRWAALAIAWALLSLPQLNLAEALVPGGSDGVAGPLLAVTVLSLNGYGLLLFFGLQAAWLAAARRPAAVVVEAGAPATAGRAA